MRGRVRLSTDCSQIKLVFRIPPDRPTPAFSPTYNLSPTDPMPYRLDVAHFMTRLGIAMAARAAPGRPQGGDRLPIFHNTDFCGKRPVPARNSHKTDRSCFRHPSLAQAQEESGFV
jgi:hypothetical protein